MPPHKLDIPQTVRTQPQVQHYIQGRLRLIQHLYCVPLHSVQNFLRSTRATPTLLMNPTTYLSFLSLVKVYMNFLVGPNLSLSVLLNFLKRMERSLMRGKEILMNMVMTHGLIHKEGLTLLCETNMDIMETSIIKSSLKKIEMTFND